MDYEYFELDEMTFVGIYEEVDMNNYSEDGIKVIWNSILKSSKKNELSKEQFYIGLEEYGIKMKTENKVDYYAMCPKECMDDKNLKLVKKTLPAGKYIKFKNIYKNHGPNFFKKVYQFISDNSISVDPSFDFEILPPEFTYDNENSTIYVGLKIKD